MSAYIVATTTIDEIIFFAIEHSLIPESEANKAGQLLIDANYKSVNTRYNLKDKAPRYVYSPDDCMKTLYAAIACCNELDYQSCEFTGWKKSKAKDLLNRVAQCVSRIHLAITEQLSRYHSN